MPSGMNHGRSHFRKTARKNPRRSGSERRHAILLDGADNAAPDRAIRMAFALPESLTRFVSIGSHPGGITILPAYFVRVDGDSAERCLKRASYFFADVAKDRPGFTVHATIINLANRQNSYGRFLTVVRGVMVVSSGVHEPIIFERAA